MGRKSTTKRLSASKPACDASIPKIVFKNDDERVPTTEYFHLFSLYVKDYLEQMKPTNEPGTSEICVPVPDTDEFAADHITTLVRFLEELKRKERDWFKKRFGKRPTADDRNGNMTLAPWVHDFCDRLDQEELFGLINAAYFFDVPVAKCYLTAYVASKANTMSVPEMREFFNEEDDFAPEDYEEFAKDPKLRRIIEKDGLMPLSLLPGPSGEQLSIT